MGKPSREVFQPMPVDRKNFLATVALGLPVQTAAAAVGWSKAETASLMMHDKGLIKEVNKFAARAEIELYTQMMESGKADWRCVQQNLERMHPEKYARPEVQAQLAASKIDSQALCEAMQEWLTIAEQRHSGITIGEARGEPEVIVEIGEPKEDDAE